MNKLELLRTFVRVSEVSSFTLAAESLRLPRSTVSEQVKALERLLGTQLFNRTTRRVQATQDGALLYERSKDLLSGMDEIESLFSADDAELAGRLRIDLPTMMARRVIIPALPQFLQRFPRLEVELSCTDRQVDLLREGFDCVMRIGALHDLDVVARPVGQLSMRNCASPAYLARYGVPQTPQELAGHQLVHYVRTLGARSAGFEYLQGGELQYQAMAGVVTVNNAEAYSAACLAGLGLIQVPAVGVAEHLQRGELVSLLEDWQAPAMPVSLLYARQRHVPRRVQAFMQWLAAVLASQVDPAPSEH
ncbi:MULTISPECIES: LysR family transcriptional regulator [Pseudomonas]|jgi:DNA-binding transcriptional LysR family regulator|uniref:LysR family transcripitonal regulator n=2 Tax=Pseudomonas TaxID=286 RepID=A0A1L7NIE7_PSEPU|nr:MULTISPECIES: LysR family transcriptional regulator [Pseudomonas]PNB62731.1 LysR family transcriptional regulator [Pseudomonas sp. FW305-130]EKT4449633.1 LysR family transcriptional regulator [Pseudomonas putida]EKT4559230.1 LysR family transcriptional regulator [Pseudomonas putida]MBH3451043.1 LysR family transcriptional regulator [Pseudomonas putida]MBH3472349.1 LysR family transcriptional regulator [Pseudomonas putida]